MRDGAGWDNTTDNKMGRCDDVTQPATGYNNQQDARLWDEASRQGNDNMTTQWDDETRYNKSGCARTKRRTTRRDIATTQHEAPGHRIQPSTTRWTMGQGVTTTKTQCERAASKWQNKTVTQRTTRWVDAMTQHGARQDTAINTIWLFLQFWLFVIFSWI